MCAIIGYLDKSGNPATAIGKLLLRMLLAVGCRGPDSTGVAIYGPEHNGFVLQIKLGDSGDFAERAEELTALVGRITEVHSARCTASYLRLEVAELSETLLCAVE